MPAPSAAVARTPLYSWHAVHGAHFTQRSGWWVAANYGSALQEARTARSGLALADITVLRRVSVQGRDVPALASAVGNGGGGFSVGKVTVLPGESGLACWLTADQILLIGWSAELIGLDWLSEKLTAEQSVRSLDVTSAWAGNCVLGQASEAVLGRLCGHDLRLRAFPEDTCVQTAFAGVEAVLVRLAGPGRFLVFVPWDVAEYVWERLLDAGRHRGLVVVGIDALPLPIKV